MYVTCTNCGQDGAAHLSLDLDLPVVTLCDFCALALTCNKELFDEIGAEHKRTGKPVLHKPVKRRSA
jgi:hypothetical protein